MRTSGYQHVKTRRLGLAAGVGQAQKENSPSAAHIPDGNTGLGASIYGMMAARAFVLRLPEACISLAGLKYVCAGRNRRSRCCWPVRTIVIICGRSITWAAPCICDPELRRCRCRETCHPFIVPQQVFVHAGAHLVALCRRHSVSCFSILGVRLRASSFSFSISAASAISSACAAFTCLSRASAFTISFENFIFGGGDFFFRELDLVQQSLYCSLV